MKIFFSHSARADPSAQLVLEAVRPLLPGHEVFIDMNVLSPGDDWCSVLYHWLAECHAAVILLNREALTSTWVHREVNILLWRRALSDPHETLKILPVVIGDLSRKDIEDAGFDELMGVQMASLEPERHARETPQDYAKTIAAKLNGTPAWPADDSAMASWARAVSDQLSCVRSKDSLVAAARELRVEDTQLDRVRDPLEGPRFVAHQLLGEGQGRGLHPAIAEIADFTPDESLSRLIRKVSATWVNGESARELLAFGVGQPGTVILNARSQRTAEQYIDRATCYALRGFEHAAVTAVAGESFLAEFEQECVQAVAYMLGVEPPFTVEDYIPPKDVLFLIVDPAKTRVELVVQGIRAVQRRFPWLVVVLLTGDALPTDDELGTWQLTDALKLEPALGPKEEADAQQVITDLKKLYRKVSGRELAGVA